MFAPIAPDGGIHTVPFGSESLRLCRTFQYAQCPRHNNNKQNKSRSNPYRITKTIYIAIDFLQHGIYSLKFFFSDGYTTEAGEELSVSEIKRILKECVDTEDKDKPYTDDELAETLKTKGYPIARRTVAKYRQQQMCIRDRHYLRTDFSHDRKFVDYNCHYRYRINGDR